MQLSGIVFRYTENIVNIYQSKIQGTLKFQKC
jgi:hypothetical protein